MVDWKKVKEMDPKTGYNIWSEEYDSGDNPLILVEEKEFLNLLPDVKGKNVLDAGCGTGRITLALLERGARVRGVDISRGMLGKAKAKTKGYGGRCELREGSINRLPYRKGEFDLVVSNLVLSHLKDLGKAFSEMSRVLKKGGTILFSDLHPYAIVYGLGMTNFLIGKKAYQIEVHAYTLEDLVRIFRKNNLEMMELREPRITREGIKMYFRQREKHGIPTTDKVRKRANGWLGLPSALMMKLKKC